MVRKMADTDKSHTVLSNGDSPHPLTRSQTKHQQNGTKSTNEKNGINGTALKDDSPQQIQHGIMYRIFNFTLMPLFMMVFSPNLVVALWYASTKCDGSFMEMFRQLNEEGILNGFIRIWLSLNIGGILSTSVILGYSIFAVLLMVLLPGPIAYGPLTPKGNRPVYRDNGFFCYIVTIVCFLLLTYVLKTHFAVSTTVIYDNFGEFIGSLTVFSLLVCAVLHFKGLWAPSTSDHGSSGNPLFDFYWGTELYPRIAGIDIKVFTNCRFGMTIWPIFVLLYAIKSYELHGFVDSMWVSCFLQMIYFTKFFWWESGYMRTIDIMVDRAGFYLCWGCLVFVPGFYASVSMYLVNQPVHLGPAMSILILILGTASVVINYLADKQKQDVRNTDGECLIWGSKPEVIRATYILENGETHKSLLLVSGYWGIARHFHYIPEILLAFFWTVPALFENLAPYSYLIMLTCILVHRTFRDDEKCSLKYKEYWKKYCQQVPYKMIPGIF